MTHAEIVNALGVQMVFVSVPVKKLVAVKRWEQRNRIPAEYWVRIVALARERRVAGVTYQALAEAIAQ